MGATGRLRRRPAEPLRGIPGTAPRPPPPRPVPASHRPGMDRLRRALRQAQGRARHHCGRPYGAPCKPRARLPAMPGPAHRPENARPPGLDRGRPARPPTARRGRRLARGDRGNRPHPVPPAPETRPHPAVHPHKPEPPRPPPTSPLTRTSACRLARERASPARLAQATPRACARQCPRRGSMGGWPNRWTPSCSAPTSTWSARLPVSHLGHRRRDRRAGCRDLPVLPDPHPAR